MKISITLGLKVSIYANNSPINLVDPNGTFNVTRAMANIYASTNFFGFLIANTTNIFQDNFGTTNEDLQKTEEILSY